MAKKAKKSVGDNINSKLQLVMKSGKYQFGRKSCLKALRTGKGTFIIFLTSLICYIYMYIKYYMYFSKKKLFYIKKIITLIIIKNSIFPISILFPL